MSPSPHLFLMQESSQAYVFEFWATLVFLGLIVAHLQHTCSTHIAEAQFSVVSVCTQWASGALLCGECRGPARPAGFHLFLQPFFFRFFFFFFACSSSTLACSGSGVF